MSYFQEASTTNSAKSQSHSSMEELNDDLPLTSLFHSRKNSTKQKTTSVHVNSKKPTQALPESMPRFSESQQSIGRKRIRVILSDDEGQMYEDVEEVECPRLRRQKGLEEQIATSDEFKNGDNLASPAFEFKDVPLANSKCAMSTCIPANVEESTCSYKSRAKVAV